jgi:signal transduction histidine kinase
MFSVKVSLWVACKRQLGSTCVVLLTLIVVVLLSACGRHSDAHVPSAHSLCDSFYRAEIRRSAIGNRAGFHKRFDSFVSVSGKHPASCHFTRTKSLSRIYADIPQLDTALIFLDSAIAIAEAEGLASDGALEYFYSLSAKGELLYAMGYFDLAYDYYFKGKVIAANAMNIPLTHYNDYGLAMICYRQKKFDLAARYFKGSCDLLRDRYGTFGFQREENMDNIALCYLQMNRFDSAAIYFDSALLLAVLHEKDDDPQLVAKAKGVVYGNMGTMLLKMGARDSALKLLKMSYDINIQPTRDNHDALLIHLKYTAALLDANELKPADKELTAIRKELDTIYHDVEQEATWTGLKLQLCEKTGDLGGAMNWYRQHVLLKDSLFAQQKRQLQSDVNRALDGKEQRYRYGLLEKENRDNRNYLLIVAAFLAMSLVIVFLIFRNFRRGKRNIALLTELNEKVSQQKNELELKNSEKDRILHIVAHDLRNPVSGIMVISEDLQQKAEGPSMKRTLGMIRQTAQNTLALINELLQLNNVPAQTADQTRITNLNLLAEDAVALLAGKAAEKKQQLVLTIADRPANAAVIPDQVSRVIGNLLANAIKFTPIGGVISLTIQTEKQEAVIRVQDNGIGIPPELRPVIFDTFSAAKRSGTSGEKSFGLGLSICRQLTEANKGRIWYEPGPEGGTVFYVAFPLK